MRISLVRLLRLPLDDYLAGLHVCLGAQATSRFEEARPDLCQRGGSRGILFARIVFVALAFLLTWWIYVPIHELAHAFGCLLTGGEVTRLEIDPLYGAALLLRFFPFVTVGSDYAGQLTGFETHGSDLIYLATDFAPFLLTVFLGVPLLRSVGAGRPRCCERATPLFFGAALPIAYAPFISLTGDYYEMGSILVSRCVTLWSPSLPLERWRSDDIFRLVAKLSDADPGLGATDAIGIGVSLLLGLALAFATYAAGVLFARFAVHRFQQGRA